MRFDGMDSPLNYIKKTPRSGVCKNFMREVNIFHLKRMIEDIAQDPEKDFNLSETPLNLVSPMEINSMLEELGWYENVCWFEGEYGCSTYTSKERSFSLGMRFNGFDWIVHLFRGAEL